MPTEQKTEEPVGAPTEAALPWWQRAKPVAAVTTIMTSAVPLTTAIYAHVEKQKEIELQAARQKHEIETARIKLMEDLNSAYLDRLKDESSRLRTLRFLEAVASNDDVRKWAGLERAMVEKEILELQQKVKAKEEEARKNEQEAQTNVSAPEADRLKLAAARARAEANRLTAQVKAPIAEAPPPALAADPCSSHPIRNCNDYASCQEALGASRFQAQTGGQNCDKLRDSALRAGCFSGPISCSAPPPAAKK